MTISEYDARDISHIACDAGLELEFFRLGEEKKFKNLGKLRSIMYDAINHYKHHKGTESNFNIWYDLLKYTFELDMNSERDRKLKLNEDFPAGLELITEQLEECENLEGESLAPARDMCIKISRIASGYTKSFRRYLVA